MSIFQSGCENLVLLAQGERLDHLNLKLLRRHRLRRGRISLNFSETSDRRLNSHDNFFGAPDRSRTCTVVK